jgi:hypothetical protein
VTTSEYLLLIVLLFGQRHSGLEISMTLPMEMAGTTSQKYSHVFGHMTKCHIA